MEENPADRIFLSESDIVSVLLEFMTSRGLPNAQLELERETGLVNEPIGSPDLLFLRTLVVDGRWDDVLEFLQPLEEAFRSFPGKKVRATILKHRFLDLLASFAASEAAAAAISSSTSENKKPAVLEDLVQVS